MKHFFSRFGVAAGLTLFPFIALAGANITVTAPMTASGGSEKNYTLTANADSITISSSNIEVTLAGGESMTVTSPDTTNFTLPTSGLPAYTETCSGTSYSATFSNGTGGATKTFTITPSTTNCGGSGSGGGSSGGVGGGSGGGGGSPAPSPVTTTVAPTPTVTPTPVPVVSAPALGVITSDLSLGMESNEVAQLQTYLATDEDLYPEGKITGYFGPATQAAVRRFQEKYGLPQVGRVGPATRAKLAEVFVKTVAEPAPISAPTAAPAPSVPASSAITQTLQLGSRSGEVSTLQTFLANDQDVYPEGLVTGYFGPATRRAVKNFQAKYGIQTLGIVGPATRAKVNELLGAQVAPAPSPVPAQTTAPAETVSPAPVVVPASSAITQTLQLGSRSDEVSTLQTFLANDQDVYPEGLVTGYFGPATRRAVKNFQAKYGIQTLGIVGPATRAKVNELLGAQPSPAPTPAPASTPVSTPAPITSEDAAKILELQAQLKALQDQLKLIQP